MVLFVCVHVSAFASLLYLASLDILCFVFFVLAFVLSAVSFCLCRLFCALVVASPHLFSLVLRLGLARDGRFFGGWGVGGGGQAQCQKRIVRFTSACGVGDARMLWLEKEKGSRDLAAGTAAQRMAQVGSRRKKNCRFSWQAAEISWHAQHRGRRKLAQEGKRIADFPGRQQRFRGRHSTEDGASWLKKEKNAAFVAGTAKRLKVAKSFLVLVFECMCVRRCMCTRAQGSESGH